MEDAGNEAAVGNVVSGWEISDRQIRQILVEIKKDQVNESLNYLSDTNQTQVRLNVPGITTKQVVLVRRWLDTVVIPIILYAVEEEVMKKMKENENAKRDLRQEQSGEEKGSEKSETSDPND